MEVITKPNTSDFTSPKNTSYGRKNSRAPSQNVCTVSSPEASATAAPVAMPTLAATTYRTGNMSTPASTRGTTR